MAMSKALDGEPADLSPTLADDALATIKTHGDPIRSWAKLATTVVTEGKLRIDQDGLHLTAVDPPNVFLIDLHAPAEGFEEFETDGEHVIGVNFDRFASAVNWARKRGGDGDPVALEFLDDPGRIRAIITRENQQMQRVSEWFTINLDKVRAEPNIPAALDLYNHATPGVRALRDGVQAMDEQHEKAYLTRDGTDFLLAGSPEGHVSLGEDDEPADTITCAATAWDSRDEDAAEADSSVFSLDYLTDMADALATGKADRVTVKWGEDYPARFAFQHEDWGFSGHFMIAPRITGETEED